MELIADFIILAASAAATVYCIVLSRRLRALGDVDKGLGAGIAAMSKTLEETRAVLDIARSNGARSVEELTPLLAEARALAPRLSELVDMVSDLAEIALKDIDDAAAEATRTIDAAAERARRPPPAPRRAVAPTLRTASARSAPKAKAARALEDLEWLVG